LGYGDGDFEHEQGFADFGCGEECDESSGGEDGFDDPFFGVFAGPELVPVEEWELVADGVGEVVGVDFGVACGGWEDGGFG
jgi:hypothetical protein